MLALVNTTLTRRPRRRSVTPWLAAVVFALTSLATPDADARAPRGRYWQAKSGVVIGPKVRAKLNTLGKHYYKKTRRKLVVTSGTRSPRRQARAMYSKLRAGSRLMVYRNQDAITPIRRAYNKGRRKRWSRARIVRAMTKIIAGQVNRGVYISRHLKAGAFDIRVRGMRTKHKRAFRRAVEQTGGLTVVEERRPPHWHLELR